MTIVISDTGPLNYLVLIDAIDVLSGLFDRVIVPEPVLKELNHERTPELVRAWADNLPEWAAVEPVDTEIRELADIALKVERGELSAMAIALQKEYPILIDDRRARKAADELGLITFGTLAILEIAACRNWLDFRSSAEKLRAEGFYLTDELIEEIAVRLGN